MAALKELGGFWDRLLPLAAVEAGPEALRLDALRAYDILDTGPEDAYDRVVELARTLFDSPIAAIGFVDEARLWFKARHGFEATEIGRDLAFCDHVIRQDDVLVIPDLTADPRFADHPMVLAEPRLRFYAGAPLRMPGGARVGTVCIMSPEIRTDFDAADGRRLAALAGIVAHELELRLQAARARRLATERGLLLQAVEHRLRSGLQLVTCVLEAQAMRDLDGAARKALHEAVDRVAMIEAVHQQLFQGSNVFQTDAREYLLALMGNLQDAVIDDCGGRALVLTLGEGLRLDAERLPAVGMVVTELLSNALRHGSGDIDVEVAREGEVVVIAVADQGRGFPADFATADGVRRLGLRLVSMLALPGGVSVQPGRRQRIVVRMRV